MIVSGLLCGTIGGVVAAESQGRAAVRARTPRRRLASRRQQQIRAFFSAANWRWSLVLSDAQREAWEDYAASLGEMTGGCEPRAVTGKDLFVGFSVDQQWSALELGGSLASVDDGPTATSRPATPTLTALAFLGSPDLFCFGTMGGPSPSAAVVLVFIRRPCSGDVRSVGDPWHLASIAEVPQSQDSWVAQSDQAAGDNWAADWRVAVGDRVRVKVRAIFADGRFSQALRTVRTVVNFP